MVYYNTLEPLCINITSPAQINCWRERERELAGCGRPEGPGIILRRAPPSRSAVPFRHAWTGRLWTDAFTANVIECSHPCRHHVQAVRHIRVLERVQDGNGAKHVPSLLLLPCAPGLRVIPGVGVRAVTDARVREA